MRYIIVINFITDYKIPLGQWMESCVDWLTIHAAVFFDTISYTLETVIMFLVGIFQSMPPSIPILLTAALAWWLHRRVSLVIFIVASLLLILNLGYWQEMLETFVLVFSATTISVLVGVPIGIMAAHRPWLYTTIRPILDLMQTVPTFVYLIPTLVLFGLGVVPGLISTIIFAIASPIRLTYLGIIRVPEELIEAGKAFGASNMKLLFKVELPAAMASIMAGVTQCIMLSLSMVVIAALVGADGLGKPVVRALNTVNISQGFEAGLAIVLVAIILDRLCKTPNQTKEQ
ncbi:choline ABC transporter permease subunit [Vibrio ruber]|nr:choline ABC transporter permease subunit [Vibrio ruber]WNJ96701.1 choline ABC transporter permease subunit [Vibrio ruber]